MLVLDDLLVKPFVSLLDVIRTLALREALNLEELEDQLKENRLLYEVGERPEEEYQRRERELERQIELAEQIRDQLSGKVEVKGQ